MENNNNVPLISVITVALNAEMYIEQCIQSVIKQKYDNFEYVIIDGGSTDRTMGIVDNYKQQLSYWHSKPDRGLAHAFNEGVLNSKGDWLIFLNSDDYFLNENVLKKISDELLRNSDSDVVFGQVNIVSRDKHPSHISGPHGGCFKWKEFLYRDTIPHQAAFTNRNLFVNDGLFNESFKIAVDYEHYVRKGSKLRTAFINQIISCMRDGGLSQKSIRQSLGEQHMARIVNGVIPSYQAYRIYAWIMLRAYVGRFVKKLLNVVK